VAVEKVFIVYIMANRKNGALYIGVTGNPVGRIWQHKNHWFDGFTKRYGVTKLVWYEFHAEPEPAIRREKQLKEWQRAWKINLIEQQNPDWRDLYPQLTEGLWT
jgi:putative endonuclease